MSIYRGRKKLPTLFWFAERLIDSLIIVRGLQRWNQKKKAVVASLCPPGETRRTVVTHEKQISNKFSCCQLAQRGFWRQQDNFCRPFAYCFTSSEAVKSNFRKASWPLESAWQFFKGQPRILVTRWCSSQRRKLQQMQSNSKILLSQTWRNTLYMDSSKSSPLLCIYVYVFCMYICPIPMHVLLHISKLFIYIHIMRALCVFWAFTLKAIFSLSRFKPNCCFDIWTIANYKKIC